MNRRIEEISVLRGISICGIVLLHVTAYFLFPANSQLKVFDLSLTLNQLVRVFLPMFLVVSGFGLAYKYGPLPGFNLKNFLLRKTKELLIPYTIWSLLYFCFYISILNKIPVGVKITDLQAISLQWDFFVPVFIKNLIFGWNYVHLYFVVLIFQFYLVFPWLLQKLKKPKKQKLFLTLGFLIYIILMIYLSEFRRLTGIPLMDLFIRYYWETFIAWYFYFLLGLIMGLNFEKFLKLSTEHSGKIGFLYALTLALVLYEAFSTNPNLIGNLTSLRVTVLFNTIPALFFFFGISRTLVQLNCKLTTWLKQIGNASFGLYLSHPMIIFILSHLLNKTAPSLFSFSRSLFVPVLFLGTLLASLTVVIIIGNVPLVNTFMLGKNHHTFLNHRLER